MTDNLRIAVPKGSLFPDAVDLLTRAGLDTTGLENPGRQLIIKNPGVEFIIVRPTDAPVFCAYGGADCGICGKDTLVEAQLNVMEMVDLKFGGCRFVVAEPQDNAGAALQSYERMGSVRVATKYPRITQRYFEDAGKQVDIIKMHGNIELAPLTGMADYIVDITATGRTLRENRLQIVDDVLASTARFIASPASARTDERVRALSARLEELVANQEEIKVTAGGEGK